MPALDAPSRRRTRHPLFNDRTLGGLLLLVGLLNALPAFLVTVRDALQYGGVDLRGRVVAVRALRMGLDPYLYDWHEGMTERLLDPGRRHPGPSRATYPPTLLMLYLPFAEWPYRAQRLVWLLLEWTALAASLALLVGLPRATMARTVFLAIGLFFFAAGDLWRFHAERGQFYVFVLLPLALGTRALVRSGGDGWRAGLGFGLAAALRPTFVLMAIPLWLLGYRRAAVAMAAAMGLAAALTLPWFGLRGWRSYSTTVRAWEHAMAAEDMERDSFSPTYGPYRLVPRTAEGIDFLNNLPIETASSTFIANLGPAYHRARRVVALPTIDVAARMGFAGFAVIAAGLAYGLRRRGRPLSPRFVACFATLAAIVGEYFLPVRLSYADVLFLHPLACLMPVLLRAERLWLARTVVVAGLVLSGYRSLLGGLVEPIEFLALGIGLTAALLQVAASRHTEADRRG